ncbi:MAG: ABC transporter permease subunit, partial [Streptosporangiaceae bacterium]
MMWLTWRQFRAQAIVTAAALAVVVTALAVSGVQFADMFHTTIAGCQAHGSCSQLATGFLRALHGSGYGVIGQSAVFLIYAVPGLIGAFWGAPLITREIETGTFRLAWTQSVMRSRWLAVKVGLIGLVALASAGLLSLMASWWMNPLYQASAKASGSDGAVDRLAPVVFGANGIAPIGYAAFGFALGLTLGVLIRRTIPAMAATLAVFAGIQVVWPRWIRPHLMAPLRSTSPLNVSRLNELMIDPERHMYIQGAASKPGAWILANQTIDPSGHPFTGPAT